MFKVIISGGGTGGHIFPAVAIGQAVRNEMPGAEILFVGAKGRMEMEKVPQAGFNIVGLPVAGINRKQLWKNFSLPFKLIACFYKARRILKKFKPNVVIGVGGYASAPVLWTAERMNIPCLIQEQNSYPGVTNLSLARKAKKICVAYDGMDKYFPSAKIIKTGNPVRQDISVTAEGLRAKALQFYGLQEGKKTLLVMGGSLGARTLNESMLASIDNFIEAGYQVLWQTGKIYYENISATLQLRTESLKTQRSKLRLSEGRDKTCFDYAKQEQLHCKAITRTSEETRERTEVRDRVTSEVQRRDLRNLENPVLLDFIKNMNYAYAVADVIISRAGALSISELALVGKPVILVPSPNVSENHQWKNAMALVEKGAAIMVEDKNAIKELGNVALELLENEEKQKQLSKNILLLAKPNATLEILKEVLAVARYKNIYFLGIGGIGMSALARYYMRKGVKVSGYDRTSTVLTRQLEAEGAIIHYTESPQLVPKDIDLVIYTPAIPADHKEWEYLRSLNIPIKKRAVILGEISQQYTTIAVAGTHGKTSTASLTAFLLKEGGLRTVAFLGGISKNINSNFLWDKNATHCVVEADEYDRSFLQLHPNYSIITSADDDHLDIYKTSSEVKNAFSQFANQTKDLLVVKQGVETTLNISAQEKVCSYSTTGNACAFAENIRIENNRYYFNYVREPLNLEVSLQGGEYSIENAIAAITVALKAGVSPEKIKEALPRFTGVKRRFDIIAESHKIIYADDYAHHPKEIETSITSFKKLYPNHHTLVVFQPHLYSRTHDFAKEFAQSLSLADEVILLDIYPARELPIENISSQTIGQYLPNTPTYKTKENILEYLKEHIKNNDKPLLLVTMGAGDIDTMVESIKMLVR